MWRFGSIFGCAVLGAVVCMWMVPQAVRAQFGQAARAADNPFSTQSAPDLFGDAEPGLDAVLEQVNGTPKVPARGAAVAAQQPPCHCADDSDSLATTRISEVLRSPLRREGLSFDGRPLQQVVEFLREEYEIPIQVDSAALDDAGLGPDEPATIKVRNISLQSALRLILDSLDLTYVVRNEVLIITTPEEAELRLRTCVYNVHDLIVMANGKLDFDSLIDALIANVATDTWAENGGGEAEIRSLPPGLLVISQTQAVHEHIAGLLAAIRRTRREMTPDGGQAAMPDVPTQLVTHSYSLIAPDGANMEKFGDNALAMIYQLVPAAKARAVDGQRCWIDNLDGLIVVHHSQDVQKDIEGLLSESGLIDSRQPGGGFGGGGGGF